MEYRRFVSYLYEYRKGEKKENRGFVKAEVRQNMARFLIHMYLPEKREQLYRVFGFSTQTNVRVLMGQDYIRNGNVDIRMQMPVDAIGIEEEKVQMNVLSGIFLKGADNSLYATLWEEGELPANLLKDKPVEKTAQPSEAAEDRKHIEPVETDTEKLEIKNPQPDDAKMENDKPEPLSDENKDTERTESKQTTEPQITKQDTNEMAGWNELILKTPRMGSLEGYDDTVFFRIEPRHLKYFPKKMWHLGRNSFLLHGYYNYRYFIAAKYKDGIVVGIPGSYSPREEQMASLFGFGRFQGADRNNHYPREFGYWMGYFKGD